MALQSKTYIEINGQEIPNFSRLIIHQAMDSHHYFELTCRQDAIEQSDPSLMDQAKNLIGKDIFITIGAVDARTGFTDGYFRGLVTEITSGKAQYSGGGSTITIKGSSPTILMDDGPHCSSYIEKDLKFIINDTIQDYPANWLDPQVKPNSSAQFPFIVQYNESGFDFISRLAARNGEWFYWNGIKLIIGEEKREEIALTYGVELMDFELQMALRPSKFQFMAHDYASSEVATSTTAASQASMNGYNQFAAQQSDRLFTKETYIMHQQLFSESQSKRQLNEAVELQREGQVSDMVTMKGTSHHPGLALGKIISINGLEESYGDYIVTQLSHSCDHFGNYQNHFQAIPAAATVPPTTNVQAVPTSETQRATVKDNNDPKGLGRIRVQFTWQEANGEKTPWLRIVNPHSGGDKGFYFIPEIGEEVLVGFEGGNAERPFVRGTLYHGQAKAAGWNTPDNDIKAIRTRSGNQVIMNDKDGSITMADPSGNVVIMKGNGEMLIKAPNKLTLTSKDIEVVAGNSISILSKPGEDGGEGTIDILAQKYISAEAADETIYLKAKQDLTLESTDASANMAAKTEININGENINVKGGSKAIIESSDTDII